VYVTIVSRYSEYFWLSQVCIYRCSKITAATPGDDHHWQCSII